MLIKIHLDPAPSSEAFQLKTEWKEEEEEEEEER